tara:strand:+ start:1081 stop:1344 length:264 start_codon:yes stop_codon:yes gene_type:complete
MNATLACGSSGPLAQWCLVNSINPRVRRRGASMLKGIIYGVLFGAVIGGILGVTTGQIGAGIGAAAGLGVSAAVSLSYRSIKRFQKP